jgi:hypothetical protein
MRKLLIGIVLAAAPTVAMADNTPAPAKKMATDDCAKARKAGKTCVIDIEGIDVEGGVNHPNENMISFRGFDKGNSLIRLRKDFIPEIIKTAEDI